MNALRLRRRFEDRQIIPLLILLLTLLCRLAPHPWNLTPVGALFVISGLYLRRVRGSWALPFIALIASDAVVYLQWDGSLLHPERLFDYGAFGLILLLSRSAAARGLVHRIGAIACTPFIFFFISNFAVWRGTEQMYPHTWSGLVDCFTAALPFFRGTLFGDWLFGYIGMFAVEGIPRLSKQIMQAV